MLDLDDEKPLGAEDLLSSWANSKTPGPAKPTPVIDFGLGSGLKVTAPPSNNATPGTPASLAKTPVPQKGLTPEQTAKIAGGLKKIVTNLNVVVVGAAVNMFGRVPAPLDDEEVALLQMGWEMYLDELLAKKKLKPIYLVIAGNVLIAISMYVGGTDKPKKQLPAADPTKAKSAPLAAVPSGVAPTGGWATEPPKGGAA